MCDRIVSSVAVAMTVAIANSAFGTPQPIGKRGNVTYFAEDWSGPHARLTVDIPAQPVGGIKAWCCSCANVGYAKGRVLSSKIVKSLHPTLDAIVLRAVRIVQLKPAVKNVRQWLGNSHSRLHLRDLTKRCSQPLPDVQLHFKMINTRSLQADLAPTGVG